MNKTSNSSTKKVLSCFAKGISLVMVLAISLSVTAQEQKGEENSEKATVEESKENTAVVETKAVESKEVKPVSQAPAMEQNADLEKKLDTNTSYIQKLSSAKYLTFGAEFHGNMSFNLTDDDNDTTETGFDITRMYFTIQPTITNWLSARTTFDFERYTQLKVKDAETMTLEEGDSPLLGFIKYAYFDVSAIDGLKLRFGQQGRAWVGTIEKVIPYRYVTKVAVDQMKYMSSTDLGLAFIGNYFNDMLQFQAGIYNGNGYKKPSKQEEIGDLMYEGKVSIFPLASDKDSPLNTLGIHGIFVTDADTANDEKTRTNQLGGALTFQHKFVDVSFDAITQSKNSDGYKSELVMGPSLVLKYQEFALFGVYQTAKNENGTDKKNWSHVVGGVSYTPIKMFAVSLDYQQETDAKWKEGETKAMFIHTRFGF